LKPYSLPLLLTLALSTTGCGSFLAALETNSIEDDPVERTLGQQIEDQSIETKAVVNVHDADEAFDEAHFSIISYNGYVLVVGQVQSERMKSIVTDEIRQIHGVRRIYNELEVAAPSSSMTRTADTWITSKVKSTLLASSEVEGTRVKVVTENGVVYLMGLATAEEAKRAVDKTAGISGVQRVVNLFEVVN
jgi:osmotically-inducible protein OsmY